VSLSANPAVGQFRAQTEAKQDLTSTIIIGAKGKPDTAYIDLVAHATAGNADDALEQCREKADAHR